MKIVILIPGGVNCRLSHDVSFLLFRCIPWIFSWRESQSHCDSYQVCDRVSLHLLHHFPAMGLHRDLADVQLQSNLFIQHAGHNEVHDIALSRRQ